MPAGYAIERTASGGYTVRYQWKAADHPRGQPENAGRFRRKDDAWRAERAAHRLAGKLRARGFRAAVVSAPDEPWNARFDWTTGSVALNAGSPWMRRPRQYCREARWMGWHSTDDPAGVVNHEIGHALHYRADPKGYVNLSIAGWSGVKVRGQEVHPNTLRAVARRVSRYATLEPLEFVAETFAGLLAGETYDEDVLWLYRRFKGPSTDGVKRVRYAKKDAKGHLHAAKGGEAGKKGGQFVSEGGTPAAKPFAGRKLKEARELLEETFAFAQENYPDPHTARLRKVPALAVELAKEAWAHGIAVVASHLDGGVFAEAEYLGGESIGLGTHSIALDIATLADPDFDRRLRSLRRCRHFSVGTVEGLIRHEIGHVLHYERLGDRAGSLRTWKGRGDSRFVAQLVSRYATMNPMEFVAETYAGLSLGKRYPSSVMKLYGALEGPPVEPRKKVRYAFDAAAHPRAEAGSDDPTYRGGRFVPKGQFRAKHAGAFRAWFGDSKVVDERGEPLVVYHGTTAAFDAFDPQRVGATTGNHGWFGTGIYLTSQPSYASDYTTFRNNQGQAGSNVMPVYASIQNPFVCTLSETTGPDGDTSRGVDPDFRETLLELDGWTDTEREIIDEALPEYAEDVELPWASDRPSITPRRLTEILKRNGYDGAVIHRHEYTYVEPDDPEDDPEQHEHIRFWEVIAFDPRQVKSATGNSGSFSREDARITYGRGPMAGYAVERREGGGYVIRYAKRDVSKEPRAPAGSTDPKYKGGRWVKGSAAPKSATPATAAASAGRAGGAARRAKVPQKSSLGLTTAEKSQIAKDTSRRVAGDSVSHAVRVQAHVADRLVAGLYKAGLRAKADVVAHSDNEPGDLTVRVGRLDHLVEVKALQASKNGKLVVDAYAMYRKLAHALGYEAKLGKTGKIETTMPKGWKPSPKHEVAPIHTIAVDCSHEFVRGKDGEASIGHEKPDQRGVYYRRGLGSYYVDQMEYLGKAGSAATWKKLAERMTAAEEDLPAAAKPKGKIVPAAAHDADIYANLLAKAKKRALYWREHWGDQVAVKAAEAKALKAGKTKGQARALAERERERIRLKRAGGS